MRNITLALSLVLFACGGADGGDDFPGAGQFPGSGTGRGTGSGSRSGSQQDDVDFGIPAEFPQLNQRYYSHGLWRVDHSGADIVPNRWVRSVEELSQYEGGASFGAVWEPDKASFVVLLEAPADDMKIEMNLPSLEVGDYDMTRFGSQLRYTERGHYLYVTAIGGGSGTVRIEGNNGTAIWGTFSARVCFKQTPNANCFSIYEGRWSAANQSPSDEVVESTRPTAPSRG